MEDGKASVFADAIHGINFLLKSASAFILKLLHLPKFEMQLSVTLDDLSRTLLCSLQLILLISVLLLHDLFISMMKQNGSWSARKNTKSMM